MRISLFVFMMLALVSVSTQPAQAQFEGPGAQSQLTTVEVVADQANDDQTVQLEGTIIEQVGDEKYIFTDGTGEIRVEIDDDLFRNQRITPDMTVAIYGEVEKDFMRSPEIDVEELSVVNE
ncbi:hypothetical protein CRI93_03005 [Longimonas halophila]|uniref:Uncharacterized protein n=1 Tax=Longimonas halophila TaxID=1469170 RepID=A0A2H3P9L9_9BACT|nr:NirD/YgiW/YdeI family stress tolerance protein [Longimonas halophila]PEN08741.1 hypothetical protein CRI93_03005 [Longimonas halophila]